MSVSFKIWTSSALHHVIIWSTRTIKSTLKICLSIREVNFKIQHLTCSPMYHHVINHHDIFLKLVTSEFPHRICHKLLIIHFFIDDLLLSKFIQARHADRVIWATNNVFAFCDGVFNSFFNFYLLCRCIQSLTLSLHCNTCRTSWNILTIKIRLNAFFPHFQLTMDILAFSFYWPCCQFFK